MSSLRRFLFLNLSEILPVKCSKNKTVIKRAFIVYRGLNEKLEEYSRLGGPRKKVKLTPTLIEAV